MAHASNITVAVESAVHKAMRDVVQNIYKQHGIIVNSVHIDWLDTSSAGFEDFRVSSVSVDSTTKSRG